MGVIQERKRKKDGKITYKAVIRIKGYPTLTATFERKTDARNWINELEPDMKKGKWLKDYEAAKHTLAELIDRYIETNLQERKSDKEKFKMHLEWWKQQIGSYLLSRVDNILLTQCRDKLAKEKCLIPRKNMEPKISDKPRSNATVNRYNII